MIGNRLDTRTKLLNSIMMRGIFTYFCHIPSSQRSLHNYHFIRISSVEGRPQTCHRYRCCERGKKPTTGLHVLRYRSTMSHTYKYCINTAQRKPCDRDLAYAFFRMFGYFLNKRIHISSCHLLLASLKNS